MVEAISGSATVGSCWQASRCTYRFHSPCSVFSWGDPPFLSIYPESFRPSLVTLCLYYIILNTPAHFSRLSSHFSEISSIRLSAAKFFQ